MSFLSTIFLAIGLAMDAFTVSITGGIVSSSANMVFALKIGLLFAGFQMIMPLIGWWLGQNIVIYITQYDHWIAFLLLCLVGARMIYESFQKTEKKQSINFNSISVLLLLALATSIDAFIAGVSLSFLELDIIKTIIIIGIITLLLSLIGVRIGKVLGYLMERYAELVGGIILISIGFQILLGHIRG
jgi:putative Mn2+ efflux pump MntP